MTQLPVYTGTITKKVGPKPSKFEDGGLRMMFEIQFSDNSTTAVWGGGNNLQEFTYMQRAQIGSPVTVEGSYKPDGSMKYTIARSEWEHIQIDPSDHIPQAPPPAPGNHSAPPYGGSPPPAAVPPPPPPPPAYSPPKRASIQPLGENALLHASVRMDDAEKVYRLAHTRAVNLVNDLYEWSDANIIEFQPMVARLATTFFLEATPWKLGQEGFDPAEYNHPTFGTTLRTPIPAERLINMLRQRAAGEVIVGEETLKKMKTLVVMGLTRLFGSDAIRKRFGQVIFEKDSTNDWTPGEINAVVNWMGTGKDVGYAIRPDVAIEAHLLLEVLDE